MDGKKRNRQIGRLYKRHLHKPRRKNEVYGRQSAFFEYEREYLAAKMAVRFREEAKIDIGRVGA